MREQNRPAATPLVLTCLIWLLLQGWVVVSDSSAADVTVGRLRCEYLVDPIGIDVPRPRLSWVLYSQRRGQKQTAYRILVATSLDKLRNDIGDLWDSSKVDSDRSIHIPYDGEPLTSRTRCYWKVRIWDKDGKPSPWSQPASWEMGLLKPDDWVAYWLSAPAPEPDALEPQPAPFFRKAFTLQKPIAQARVYITGLGYYELYLNGSKVGDHLLDPAFTRYDRRVLYVTYDVTKYLQRGENAIGIIVGNGWYNMHTRAVWDFDKAPWRDRPSTLCQLEVRFTDGSVKTIATDNTWKFATGPIRFDSIRNGEVYDARLELPDWSSPQFDDRQWLFAQVVSGPKGKLTAQMLPPIKITKTLAPVKLTEPKDGIYVFDIGQNIAGFAQLRTRGPRGTKVTLKYAERLNPDGTVDQKEIGKFIKSGQPQTDFYTLKGQGIETWRPRFVYHGFRYVQVTGLAEKPTLDSLRAHVVHTAFEPIGSFQCSSELLNRIHQNTLWSYISNFHGYPTDCPHREKNGWTGDAHLAAEQGLLNFASAAAYTKWLNDIKDEQRPSGELPGIVPTSGWGYHWGNGPAWDSAYILIAWYLHQYRGDVRILEQHYDRFKRYVDYLTSKASDHIVALGLGDWVPARSKTPRELTSTGYYYCDALIVSKIARLLGKTDDARKYAQLADQIKRAFNRHFYRPDTGVYDAGTQTAASCALYHKLVPPDQRPRVLHNLIKNILDENAGHLDAGILGTKYLLDVLTDAGRADVAYTIATRTTFPSWGHWIEQGATTLWEQWDGGGSRNHIMFGHISAWFYKALAGINPDPNRPGFKHIIIRPCLLGDLRWVEASHLSMFGRIESAWRRSGDIVILEITIPPNTTATVYVPTSVPTSVTESGRPAEQSPHVRLIRTDPFYAVFEVDSGKYRFAAKLAP